ELLRPGVRIQGYVDDVADPGLARPSGAGIERELVGRGIKEARIVGEAGLRAIAVMDVEIDHRDAGEAVRLARPQRPNRDIVEEAEAHRPPRLGMMAGWAHRAEGVVGFARDDRIDGSDYRPGG